MNKYTLEELYELDPEGYEAAEEEGDFFIKMDGTIERGPESNGEHE